MGKNKRIPSNVLKTGLDNIATFESSVHQINSFQEVLELEQVFQKN